MRGGHTEDGRYEAREPGVLYQSILCRGVLQKREEIAKRSETFGYLLSE